MKYAAFHKEGLSTAAQSHVKKQLLLVVLIHRMIWFVYSTH